MTRATPPMTMAVSAPMTKAASRSVAAAASAVLGARGVVSVTGAANLGLTRARCPQARRKPMRRRVLDFRPATDGSLPASREEVHMAQFTKVASTADLAPGAAKCVEVAGKKIALFNLEGSFYAIDDTCTHRGGPLSEGEVSGEEVTCPWHGAIYNIKTGAVLGPPAPRGVARYPVRVQGSDVEVEV